MESEGSVINRRGFLRLTNAAAVCAFGRRLLARENAAAVNLLAAPIELKGDWLYSDAVMRVLSRVRAVDLSGVRLLSDRQPAQISVENHNQGPPAIWLHSDDPERAAIIVDIGPSSDWCKLAYQFGHELGHVLSNSWQFSAKPQHPTQWLEEALVETFSIRGLRLLADSWERSPTFAGDNAFAASIRQYRSNLLEANKTDGAVGSQNDAASWFHASRADLESGKGVPRGLAILGILALYEEGQRAGKPSLIDDLGALNRWPERSAIPIERYLERWKQSCSEIGASAELSTRLERLFRLS
jgi:hypothetical protein